MSSNVRDVIRSLSNDVSLLKETTVENTQKAESVARWIKDNFKPSFKELKGDVDGRIAELHLRVDVGDSSLNDVKNWLKNTIGPRLEKVRAIAIEEINREVDIKFRNLDIEQKERDENMWAIFDAKYKAIQEEIDLFMKSTTESSEDRFSNMELSLKESLGNVRMDMKNFQKKSKSYFVKNQTDLDNFKEQLQLLNNGFRDDYLKFIEDVETINNKNAKAINEMKDNLSDFESGLKENNKEFQRSVLDEQEILKELILNYEIIVKEQTQLHEDTVESYQMESQKIQRERQELIALKEEMNRTLRVLEEESRRRPDEEANMFKRLTKKLEEERVLISEERNKLQNERFRIEELRIQMEKNLTEQARFMEPEPNRLSGSIGKATRRQSSGDEVSQWLRSLGLEKYITTFLNHGYNKMIIVQSLDATDLDSMSITDTKDRGMLLGKQRKSSIIPPSTPTKLPSSASHSSDDIFDTSSSSEDIF